MSYNSKINASAVIDCGEGMMEVKDAATNTAKDKAVEFENFESKHSQRQHYSQAAENENHENKRTQRQHYSEAGENENHENERTQRQHYSEAGENAAEFANHGSKCTQKRHYSAGGNNVNFPYENFADAQRQVDAEILHPVAAAGIENYDKCTQPQHYFEAGENVAEFGNHESKCIEKRHYSEAGNNVNFPYENFADAQRQVDAEILHPVAAAGIKTEIENYDNIRSQRRHYCEADEMTDATEVIAADVEGEVEPDEEIAEKEEAARVEKIEETARIEKKEEAARVEKKITEDWEGKPSHRRHFPGSTTSNIFR